MSYYGLCPVCKAPGHSRERRINGNDCCTNGHIYPSRTAIRPGVKMPDDKSASQPIGDRESIVNWLRREYGDGPWKGETLFLILAEAIENEMDKQDEPKILI